MYNEKIEALIKAALADGVLTEKEKQVLFKKAQEQGIDLDEFEMVLDARLAELQKAEKSAPKSNKFGDVRKCPACGAIVASGSAICVECGYAFTEDEATTAMEKLYERLQVIDNQYVEEYDKNDDKLDWTGNRTRYEFEKKRQMSGKKMQAIRTFNVPNTRAELLGLLASISILANPRGSQNGRNFRGDEEDLSLAYWDLFSTCINRAKISFAKDSNFTPYFEQYDQMLAKSKKFKLGPRGKLLLGILALPVLCFISLFFIESENGDTENAKYEEVQAVLIDTTGYTTTASGLRYKVLKEGYGTQPTITDNVEVHYTGKLLDGTVFDSSVERGETISFPLNGVIKGWAEGLQLMKEGAKYEFIIPSDLAYGEKGTPGSPIGPNATLYFEVELFKVK